MTDSELEQRLRRTLAARADRITQDRLQPAVPPTSSVRPGLAHRIRWWMPALAGAALIAAVVLVRLPGPDPVAPVAPPPSVPAPATSPARPSPSSPAAGPAPTASFSYSTATAPAGPQPRSTGRPGSVPSAAAR